MGVLQDFERRLEGAVEGVFARMFRSGLQPVELAKGLQRYARDTQQVSHDGVVVPNAFRFTINSKDLERFERYGTKLQSELSEVIMRTARQDGWILRGPAVVQVVAGDVPVGRYDIVGRIETVEARDAADGEGRDVARDDHAAAHGDDGSGRDRSRVGPATTVLPSASGPGPAPSPRPAPATPTVHVVEGGATVTVELTTRTTAGRAVGCDVVLEDSTVSREHAAFVRRATGWWVVDLGSMNGTKVNGRAAGEHQLSDGDRIELGEAVLEFRER